MKIYNEKKLCTDKDLVVFIITYNRKNMLNRILDSYNKLLTKFNIIIIDNGTNDEFCKENLYSLDYTIIQFDFLNENPYESLINNINESVKYYYNNYYSKYYAVSDADISFENTKEDVFEVYMRMIDLLNANIGPRLNTSNIPDHYPLKMNVMFSYIYNNNKDRCNIIINNKNIEYIHEPIDTTFTMFLYENNKVYKPCQNTISVFEPYDCLHLDWYFNAINFDNDSLIYMNSSAKNLGGYASGYIRIFVNNYLKENKAEDYVNENYDVLKNNILFSNDNRWSLVYWLLTNGHYIKPNVRKANDLVMHYLNCLHDEYKRDNYYDGIKAIQFNKDYFNKNYNDLIIVNKNNINFYINKKDNSDRVNNFWVDHFYKWKDHTFHTFDKYLEKDKIFIDIGGWVGTTSIYAAEKSKYVYVIEADPESFDALVKNNKLNNNNVIFINKAFYNINDIELEFGSCSSNEDWNTSSSSILPQNKNSLCKIKIKSINFEYLFKDYNIDVNNISLIKIDIEGGEEFILEDIIFISQTYNIVILVSFHYDWWVNKNLDRFNLSNELKNYIINHPFSDHIFTPL
jgi:FkbM family methyltransferase